MKKLYIILFAFLFLQNKAQHTLTASFNPVFGDIESYIEIDTTGLSLGSSGVSQTWNYTGISTGTNTPFSYTYIPMSSVINYSLYPTGTIAMRYGVGGYDKVYNNTSSQIEFLGFAQPTASNCQVYTDPAIFYSLPFTYGSSSSDTYSYTSWTGTYVGTITTTGDGTGTLQLPSGTFSNIFKLTIIYNQPGSFNSVENRFYSALSKFPLLTISSYTVGSTVYKGGMINTLVANGIKNSNENNTFFAFPNPVTNGDLFLKSGNEGHLKEVEITNILGQVILYHSTYDINTSGIKKIDVSSLQKGVYFLNIKGSDGSITKKIIIE